MLDIKITRNPNPKPKPQDETQLGFGKLFTDHMFLMDYTLGEGWHDPPPCSTTRRRSLRA